MTDYILTRYSVTNKETMDDVVALLETRLETLVNTKVIRMYDVFLEGHSWHGYIVYDT